MPQVDTFSDILSTLKQYNHDIHLHRIEEMGSTHFYGDGDGRLLSARATREYPTRKTDRGYDPGETEESKQLVMSCGDSIIFHNNCHGWFIQL